MGPRDKRTICVFTGSRADYAPRTPLLRRLHADPDIELRILVTGGHLVPEQGLTVQEIKNDGFNVGERVDMVLASDNPSSITKSFGLACIGYADALDRISPDLLVIGGDRYEALAAAVAALPRLLPVVHIAGGQLTQGSIDDQTRHAISKLSHLHFTHTSADRRRLIRMGEMPQNVYNVGPISIDPDILQNLPDLVSLEDVLEITLRHPVILVTYHPATASPHDSWTSALALLEALDQFPDATLVMTAPNVDRGSLKIHEALRLYVARRNKAAILVPSLGQRNYLGLLKRADAVVGNSSSGVIEAPLLRTPTVNIGDRQLGRHHPPSVVDCRLSAPEIAKAIQKALHMPSSTYEPELDNDQIEASLRQVVEILKQVDLEGLTPKPFFDDTFNALSGEVIH